MGFIYTGVDKTKGDLVVITIAQCKPMSTLPNYLFHKKFQCLSYMTIRCDDSHVGRQEGIVYFT